MYSRLSLTQASRLLLIALALLVLSSFSSAAAEELPQPKLKFDGTETYQAGGKTWVRYKISVINRAEFSADLFQPAPNLPPCGNNANSARAWVDIKSGVNPYPRLYGFCALGSPADLGSLWFAVERGKWPPRLVYITITDRRTGKSVSSGRIEIPS